MAPSMAERFAGKPIACPSCGNQELRFAKSIGNGLRVAVSLFFAGAFQALGPWEGPGWLAPRWRCPHCHQTCHSLTRRQAGARYLFCRRCGYNLKGNVSGVCPECGEAIRADAKERGSGSTLP